MLIIGHRGAAGLAAENTLAALEAGYRADADMLEFDIRLTSDKVPLLLHDASLKRTHHLDQTIGSLTYTKLKSLTNKQCPPTFETILDHYEGKILLNVELKSRGSGRIVTELLAQRFKNHPERWDHVLLSSFKITELIAARRVAKRANLAMLHDLNPFTFITYQRFLNFTAVGFHRLHLNKLATEIARKTGIVTYVYTVNRSDTARRLAELGYNGVVTNFPDRITTELNK